MGSRELTHITPSGSGKGWYRSDVHGGSSDSSDPANGWKINADGSWTDPQGTTYTKDGWIDSQGYIHEANGDIVEPGPFGQDNLVVHPDGTYFDPGLPNGGGTVNPKTGSWVDANGTIHSPSGLTLDPDGNTTYPDGQVQTSGGWTINSDGTWTDPDGNTYYIDGTWTDRDGNLHYTDGTWTDKDGVTHYENGDTSLPGPFGGSYVYHQDGSWTDPDGTQHNSDGTIHTGFTVTAGDTTGDAVDVVTGAGDIGGDDSDIYDTSSAEGDVGTSASTDASDVYDVSPTDDGSSSGDSSSDDSSSNDDHHDDDNTDDQTAAPADPPAPDDGGPTGGSDSDPEGDGEERPGLGHHAHPARGSTPAGHGTGTAGTGDTDNAGGGYGWTHFGAPRSDDGDNGDEKPSLGHHSTRHDSGHGPHLPGSGLQGSTGDSDYVGGGYGWNLHGAPRADTAVPGIGDSVGSATTGLAGQGISTGGGLTVDSAPLPGGAGPQRRPGRRSRHGRARLLVSAGLFLALPIGALALTFGGARPSGGPTTSPVTSTTAAVPTSAIVPPSDSVPVPAPLPQATEQTTPPAPVVTTTQTVPVTTTTASAPTPADETSTVPTTSANAPTTTITATPPRTPIILPPSVIAPIPVIPNHHSATGGSAPRISTDSAPHNIDGVPRQRTITHHGS
ncbi:hypothetical protein [Mycolicibacterium sp. HS_4_1]